MGGDAPEATPALFNTGLKSGNGVLCFWGGPETATQVSKDNN